MDAIRSRRNLHLEQPRWQYEPFDLERMEDHECKVEFRLKKGKIYALVGTFELPDVIKCPYGTVLDSVEAPCICFKRFVYPSKYVDLIPRLAGRVPHLCMVSDLVTVMTYDRFRNLFTTLDQPWLSPGNLQAFAGVMHCRGTALDNFWGFIDETARPIYRPERNQRVLYNGHKRIHALKFQSAVTPNCLIDNMYIEGRRHDSAILAISGLLPRLEQHSYSPNVQALFINGDPAEQHDVNRCIRQVRVSVGWVFGDIVNYFKFTGFRKNLKIGLSSVGKIYSLCALLRNH